MKHHLVFPLMCLLLLTATAAISAPVDAEEAHDCNNKVCSGVGVPLEVCTEQVNGPDTNCEDYGTCSWDSCNP